MILNRIINYYVSGSIEPNGNPRVFRSPITMGHDTAKKLIDVQLKREGSPPLAVGPLLHVCYDAGSQNLYLPNASAIGSDKLKLFFDAARLRITKDFGDFPLKDPIEGDPFSSLRIRSAKSFPYAEKVIGQIHGGSDFKDIPVIECDLRRMPTTLKTLPSIYQNEEFMGSYIGQAFADSIRFVDEIDKSGRKRKRPRELLSQKTPFILINTSREVKATEKEWVVISGYRDYLKDNQDTSEEGVNQDTSEEGVSENITDFADLYAIKRLLYLGWTFEEVSYELTEKVKDFGGFIKAVRRLMSVANSLASEGYGNPAESNYYATFKINLNDFPIHIGSTINRDTMRVDPSIQNEDGFKILDFDMETSYVLIQTPIFITPTLCETIMKAKSKPFVTKYNNVLKRMDVKSDSSSYSKIKYEGKQLAKIEAVLRYNLRDDEDFPEKLEYRTGPGASGASVANSDVYNVRFISDYYFAMDNIKAMCKEYDFTFQDLMVIQGPIERMFGRGTQGGYMDEAMWKENKMAIPYELEKDFWINPPAVFINSASNPSYAEQTETLIHEYRHHIFGRQNPGYAHKYKSSDKKGEIDLEYWFNYLTDEDEIAAHKIEVKHALMLGKSVDEIIRNKVGGEVTGENYPIARKYEELVMDAAEEFEAEEFEKEMQQNEEPIGTD